MSTYQELVNSVVITNKNRLECKDDNLLLVGTGRSAFVFRIQSSNKAIKIFFPKFTHIAQEEAAVYQTLQGNHYFPTLYEAGDNYLVIDYIKGVTLFECITQGKLITAAYMDEINSALSSASAVGLNPSDIHLRNIIIDENEKVKLIDVARYRQKKDCKQWNDFQKAYAQFYCNRFFTKKVPSFILNLLAFLYKKRLIPYY